MFTTTQLGAFPPIVAQLLLKMASNELPMTPRVNGATMTMNKDQAVRIIGKLSKGSQVAKGQLEIVTSDNQLVRVLNVQATIPENVLFVEILGKVNKDNTVTSYSCTPFGNNFSKTCRSSQLFSNFPQYVI